MIYDFAHVSCRGMCRHETKLFNEIRKLMITVQFLQHFCLKCENSAYRKFSNISRTKSQNLNVLVSSCSCLCPIYWSQVLSGEWRCSWRSADRRCLNYIWVINNFIAYLGASYIRDLTVIFIDFRIFWGPKKSGNPEKSHACMCKIMTW